MDAHGSMFIIWRDLVDLFLLMACIMFLHVCICPVGVQVPKKPIEEISLDLDLQIVVSHPKWVLGT